MKLCANCGRPIFKTRSEFLGEPREYWMHRVSDGGDTRCGLEATPQRYKVRWQDGAHRWRFTVHFSAEEATAALAEVQKTYPNAYAVQS